MRLDFSLPEFLRTIWSSNEARMVWESRIQRISSAWMEIERLAVAAKIKPAALQVCPPENLPRMTLWALDNGLVCVPLSQQGISDGYANGTRTYEPGRQWGYRVVFANPDLARVFMGLWREQDDEAIGAALGFPVCCREFFLRNWVKEGWRDLTYPMVGANGAKHSVSGPLECNILLRWLGLRLVSHLPCSFNCDATQTLGEQLQLLGIQAGYVAEMDWLSQILSWPVRWSSLHGVAIITTPIFRLVVDSTALKSEVIIDRDGPGYPAEAARGNQFPFKDVRPVTLFRDEHTDNGFSSEAGMKEAHEKIIMKIISLKLDPGKILDLGCGNGRLLTNLGKCYPRAKLYGVEIDETKHQRAARRLLSDIRCGDISDFSLWNEKFDVILIAEQRLEEDATEQLLDKLHERGKRVVIYNYATGTIRV